MSTQYHVLRKISCLTVFYFGLFQFPNQSTSASQQGRYVFELHTENIPIPILATDFSPDGKALAIGGNSLTTRVFDLTTGEITAEVEHGAEVQCLAFSPNGKLLATGGWNGRVRIWDLQTEKEINAFWYNSHPGQIPDFVYAVAFTPDSQKILAGIEVNSIGKLWDIQSGDLLQTIEATRGGSYQTISFFPDGKRVLIGQSLEYFIWSMETGQIMEKVDEGYAVLTRNKEKVLSYKEQKLKRKDAQTKSVEAEIALSQTKYFSFAASPDGSKGIVGGGTVNRAYFLDVSTGNIFKEFRYDQPVYRVNYSQDGKKIVVVAETAAYVYDVDNLLSSVSGAELYEK